MNEVMNDQICEIGFNLLKNPKVREKIISILLKLSEADEKFLSKFPSQPPEPLILERADLGVIGMSLSILLWVFKKTEEEESKKPEVDPNQN